MKENKYGDVEDTNLEIPLSYWNVWVEKAWKIYFKKAGFKEFLDYAPVVKPYKVAWPRPPAMYLNMGSLLTIAMCDYMTNVSFTGCINIWDGMVTLYPNAPHPVYRGDYHPTEWDGEYEIDHARKQKIEQMLDIELPNESFILTNRDPGRPNRRHCDWKDIHWSDQICNWEVVTLPDEYKVWNWVTGEKTHGIMHYAAPPEAYRYMGGLEKKSQFGAGHSQVSSITEAKFEGAYEEFYVGFTYYKRPTLKIKDIHKFLQPRSSGLNKHKFRVAMEPSSTDFKDAGWTVDFKWGSQAMPPEWCKALFACLYHHGLFNYIKNVNIYTPTLGQLRENKDKFYGANKKKAKRKMKGVINEEIGITGKFIKVPNCCHLQKCEIMKKALPPKYAGCKSCKVPKCENLQECEKTEKTVPPRYAECKSCEEKEEPGTKMAEKDYCIVKGHGYRFMDESWPGRCLKCHPIDGQMFPTFKKGTRWVWDGKTKDFSKSERRHFTNEWRKQVAMDKGGTLPPELLKKYKNYYYGERLKSKKMKNKTKMKGSQNDSDAPTDVPTFGDELDVKKSTFGIDGKKVLELLNNVLNDKNSKVSYRGHRLRHYNITSSGVFIKLTNNRIILIPSEIVGKNANHLIINGIKQQPESFK
jgi:hypothetical protein